MHYQLGGQANSIHTERERDRERDGRFECNLHMSKNRKKNRRGKEKGVKVAIIIVNHNCFNFAITIQVK